MKIWKRHEWKPAPQGLAARAEAALPQKIRGTGAVLDAVPVEALLRLQDAQWRDGMERMTCRPLRRRPERENAVFFRTLLENPACLICGIFLDAPAPVGKITASDYNARNESAELGYFLLPEYRGRGLMRAALSEFCGLLFGPLGVRKVYAQTGAFNAPSIRLLESLGFHRDGLLREHHEMGGKYYDDLIFSLLAREYAPREENPGQ